MLEKQEIENLRKIHKTSIIIWVCFIVSVFLYGAFIFYLFNYGPNSSKTVGQISGETPSDLEFLRKHFNIILAGIIVISLVPLAIEKNISNPENLIKRFISQNKTVSGISGIFQSSLLIKLSFRESLVLYGLFLSIADYTTVKPIFYICFALVGLFLIIRAYPSFDSWVEKAEELKKLYPEIEL